MAESAKPEKKKKKNVICKVLLLDDSEIEVTLDKKAKGRDLIDSVCKYLRLLTSEYFGLIHVSTPLQRLWVKDDKKLRKQFRIKNMEWSFAFRVRYYPQDPSVITEDIAKYQMCLQVRLDLTTGVLPCPLDVLAEMSSHWLQSEFGDAENDAQEVREYLSSLRPSENPPALPDFDKRVLALYKTRKGTMPSDADARFLNLASNLPLYGVHFFKGKDKAEKEVSIGIGAAGIYEKRPTVSSMTHTWRRVKNIEYSKNKFYLKLLRAPPNGDPRLKKTFIFPNEDQTSIMWQCGVDHHVFFRIDSVGSEMSPASTQAPKAEVKRKRSSLKRLFSSKKKDDVHLRPTPKLIRGASFRRSASFRDTSASTTQTGTPVTEPKPDPVPIIKVQHTEPQQDKINANDTKVEDVPKAEEDASDDKTKNTEEDQRDGSSTVVAAVVENVEIESEGEEFKDDDFVDDVMDAMDATMKETSNSTLLLTETIEEEDEDLHHSVPKEVKDMVGNLDKDLQENIPPILETSFEDVEQKADYPAVKFDTSYTNESDTDIRPSVIKDNTPNHVTEKIFERDVNKDENNYFLEIPTHLEDFGEPLDMSEMINAEEEEHASAVLTGKESGEDSEDDTLTPDGQEPPRKRSEVRFQDEMEIILTPQEEDSLPEFEANDDASVGSSTSSSSKEGEFVPSADDVFNGGIIFPPRYEDVDTDEADAIIQNHPYEEFSIEVPQFSPRKPNENDKRNKKSDFKVSTWKQSSFHENYNGEDENRNEGLSTTGAELGDDDFLLDELEEVSQMVSEDLLEFDDNEVQLDTTINLEDMEDDSISDITDDTDELCSPKIVEETWLRTLGPENEIFMELFKKKPQNVKLRRDKNKNRNTIRSQVIDVDEQDEIMLEDDAATPRITDVYSLPKKITPRREPLVEREGSSSRRFIPSWPFDPQSYISKMEGNDLDKEAVKAAIEAQKELVEENKRIEEMDFWMSVTEDTPDSCLTVDPLSEEDILLLKSNDSLLQNIMDEIESEEVNHPHNDNSGNLTNKPLTPVTKLHLGSRSPSTSPRMIGEKFIPGVPDFVHSVIHNYLHSSSSGDSATPSETVPQNSSRGEELKYPAPIITFAANGSVPGERPSISYEPAVGSTNIEASEDIVFQEEAPSLQSNSKTLSTPTFSGESNDENFTMSTSSSTSSFPSFVHSVYPLRKLSATFSSRKRGRSKQRKERKQNKNKIVKKKSKSGQRKTVVENAQNVNHKQNEHTLSHTDTPRPQEQEIDKIVLSENDDSHFAGNETPDTVRKVTAD